MGFEFREMIEVRQNIRELSNATDDIYLKVAKRIAQLAIRKVKKMTPVGETGDLRNNWKFQILKSSKRLKIIVYNQVEYASFVENGHRIVRGGNTVGWVEGRFMLKLTKAEMDRVAPNMWKKEIDKEMRRIFGS